ncbi:unnamed protein product [Caenorhabditis brenneri]
MKIAICLPIVVIFTQTVHSQKVSGDVGVESEIQSDIVTINPNPFNIPTINWDDILKNIPTIPPLILPTLDPNFWQNLPTLSPIVLPTIDPDFWKKIPTIPPFQLPTLDPNFWIYHYLKSIISQQNLNIPTLPPLPTLDPNFWQNLPTLPTFPPLVFPTVAPKTSQCTYKLSQEISNNETFSISLNYTDVQSVVNALLDRSLEICTGFQTQRLTDLSKKYGVLIADLQDVG